jgi:hypothetical protein
MLFRLTHPAPIEGEDGTRPARPRAVSPDARSFVGFEAAGEALTGPRCVW